MIFKTLGISRGTSARKHIGGSEIKNLPNPTQEVSSNEVYGWTPGRVFP